MIALLKYGTGGPFKRLERLQEQLGMPLAATTQWDLVAAAAQLMRPVLEELIRLAAQGSVMHNDDAGTRILRLTRGRRILIKREWVDEWLQTADLEATR